MEEENIIIELKNKMISLKTVAFDTDIDVDEILKIDYNNILGEILTFPVLFNRIANLKAEQQSIVSETKTDLEIFEAEIATEKRKEFYKSGNSKPTVQQLDFEIKQDKRYKAKYFHYHNVVKNLDLLDSLYWSAKLKSDLLTKISDKLRPEEFNGELLAETINGVMIKAKNKLIQ